MIGFDEGPKLADWVGSLEVRGIAVIRDVLRHEAAVLREYAEGGRGDLQRGNGIKLRR